MNTYNVNDEEFLNSSLYQNFIKDNPSQGYLRIRAYAASQAIPISGVKIVVSTNIGDNQVIFFEGYTNESGIIEKITLPAPEINLDNLNVPNTTTYSITATYGPNNISRLYKVNMYENVYVVQTINIVPDNQVEMGGV